MVQVNGLQRIMARIHNAPEKIRMESAKALQDYGNLMVKYARANHDFTSRTGQLERAIEAKVDAESQMLMFWINPDFVTVKGYNYGVIQHDGSRSGWKPSEFSPPSFTSKGGTGGVKADHFMVRASEVYKKQLVEALEEIVRKSLS